VITATFPDGRGCRASAAGLGLGLFAASLELIVGSNYGSSV
jgi:hypothetical protein